MDFEIAKKALMALGVAAGAGGSGAYMFMPRTKKNVIIEKLAEKQYTILTVNSENTSTWQAILDSYKSSNGEADLHFDGFSGIEDGALSKLQKLCQQITKPLVSSNKKSDINYKKAEKWCIEPVTISSILGKWGTRGLNIAEGGTNEDDGKWKEKIVLLKKEKKEKYLLPSLWFAIGHESEATSDDLSKMKKACKELGDKKNHDDKYMENLEKFKSWCSE